jgi:hypothetical protein
MISRHRMKFVQYICTVYKSLAASELPRTHIFLSPFVPYIKYIALPTALVITCHATSLDAMFVRMAADADAKYRLEEQRKSSPQSPIQYNADFSRDRTPYS